DVYAVVADASALAFDSVADAAFAGNAADVETQYARARAAGTLPNAIAMTALRQAIDLHRAKVSVEAGESVDAVLGSFRPPVHFKRKPIVEAALRNWSATRLESAMQHLAGCTLESRKQLAVADAIVERALLNVAQSARRKN